MRDQLAAAGIRMIPIPTPFAVGRINVFLIEDDPLTLVDSGPNSGKALDELEIGLAAHGRRIEDLERVVITHQHIDHMGLVSILARRSGAEVCALDRLAPWLARYSTAMEGEDAFAEALMKRHGFAEDVRYALRTLTHSYRAWGASCRVTRPLADGSSLPFADRTLHVLHRPGHSPSDTVFHDAERRLLFGGDHLLGQVSSNALVTRPLDGHADPAVRPRPLATYLESMRATREMELDLVLPGHGDLIEDHRALIDERIRLVDRRARRLGALVAEQPRTAHELAYALWGNVAVTQAFLTLSEVLGHLDLLIEDGSVIEVEDDHGVVRFAPA